MIEEKYLELIHAELDGELPDEQRADLSRYLLANPEARALRDELRRVCAALDGIEPVEPPRGLREAIIEAIATRRPARIGLGARRRPAAIPAALRYAAAFAGGLLFSAIAFQVGFESRDGLGVSELVGTMTASGPGSRVVRADSVRLALEQLEGEVTLYDTGSARVLVFDLAPQRAIEVVTAYDGREARISWDAPVNSERLQHAMSLAGSGRAGQPVTVRFLAAGELIHGAVLEIPAAR